MRPSQSRVQRRVGWEVRRARVAAGMTQRELASSLGRSQSWVAGVERGTRGLLAAELVEVASVLGADAVELLARALADS